MLTFQITARDPQGHARRGFFETPHGRVDTPAFMPVGTKGTVKGLWPEQIAGTGTQILLGNTYHLAQRPGAELVAEFGGLHRFMNWPGPILTDSGGYQVFSLAELNTITDEGVTFRSHIDGHPVYLDPAEAMRIQNALGADIIMAFDQCPPAKAELRVVRDAVDRTLRWALASRRAHARSDQALFGIVQGGLFLEERQRCAAGLMELNFPGYAVGGLSVGESYEERQGVLEVLTPTLPADRPRYLMGVGTPRDILGAVRSGIDMFDCVMPTRNGRNACAFTAIGKLKLRNEQYRRQEQPLEDGCGCPACQRFSRGYIRHLFLVREMLGPILVSLHNLWFFQRFMQRIRDLIPAGDWTTMLDEFPVAAGAPRDRDTTREHAS